MIMSIMHSSQVRGLTYLRLKLVVLLYLSFPEFVVILLFKVWLGHEISLVKDCLKAFKTVPLLSILLCPSSLPHMRVVPLSLKDATTNKIPFRSTEQPSLDIWTFQNFDQLSTFQNDQKIHLKIARYMSQQLKHAKINGMAKLHLPIKLV